MKNIKLVAVLLILVTAMSLAWVKIASAQTFRSGSNITIGQAEQIDSTLFVAGRNIDINSEVFGDVFCAGQTVNINASVHGDIICAAQTINVSGKVDGDVRLAGQTVTVSAQIAGNGTIGGQSFTLNSNGTIDGDLTVGSADATVNGAVGRDIVAGSSNLTISSSVGRNVKGNVNNLNLTSGAKVQGNIDYTSNNDLNRASGAQIEGEVTRTTPKQPAASKRGAVFGFGVVWFLYLFFAMLLTAMALALLFPRVLHTITNQAIPKPWKALLTGFLASIAMPFVLLLLAISIIGIPLAFIVGLLWLVVFLLSGPIFGYYLGRLILRDSNNSLLIMLVGASVLLVLYFIPILGFFVLLAASWIGIGMILLEAFKRTPKPQYTIATTNTNNRRKS
jgi:cytoskeletal protein CcmA (bactofilin family)